MRWGLMAALGLTAACYAPQVPAGAPCANALDCPTPLVCATATNTCEVGNPSCGDTCVDNDRASGAIDVTEGGSFTGEIGLAGDDVTDPSCGGDGGRDVFYKVTLATPQVYYFDTFGSSFDTILRVYAMPCGAVGSGAGATLCADDACSTDHSQVAVSLPAGESCVVVDQASGEAPGAAFLLTVLPGGFDGLPLGAGMKQVSGDTCGSPDTRDPQNQSCDGPGPGGAKDDRYFFTACPGVDLTLDAAICPEPVWDPVLYVRRAGGSQLACNDDSCGQGPRLSDETLQGGTLYFLFVDGFDDTDCGPYDLDTQLR